MAFHEALNAELRSVHGVPEIMTTIIHPSWVDTPMLNGHIEKIKKAGMQVMEIQVVVDAIVKQYAMV